MNDIETYDDVLGYDADHSDESQYCQHGTFIGSWWGPDYLCGLCELGVSRASQLRGQVTESRRYLVRERQQLVDVSLALVRATGLLNHAGQLAAAQVLVLELGEALVARDQAHRDLVRATWQELHPSRV